MVTGEPTVTGDAKDNLQVLWGEGLSSLGIVYNETRVPGQAVITIPTGPKANGGTAPVKNVEIIVNFANNATSGSYVLSGGMGVVNFKLVDDLEYAYTNGRFNFDTLDVARARFVEDGPFELFFYGLYKAYNGPYLQGCTFGSELVEKVEFESSDPSILQVTKNLSKATLKLAPRLLPPAKTAAAILPLPSPSACRMPREPKQPRSATPSRCSATRMWK